MKLSPKQQQAVELSHLPRERACKIMGISDRAYRRHLEAARSKGLDIPRQSENSHTIDSMYTAPEGYKIKGTSSLVDSDGNTKLQWIKTDIDKERQEELMREAIEAMKEEIKPLKKIPKKNSKHNDKLLNLYTLTDFHLGMLAWDEETGANWDTGIAENMMVEAFRHLIESSPDAEVGFFNQLGDLNHYDSLESITPMNKHLLDADSRPVNLVRTAIRVSRQIVEMMAEKYNKVVVLHAEGNHDMYSSVWLRELFAELYRNNPRIEVFTDPLPYYAYEWGYNMLGFHHGHLKKNNQVADVFISDYREMYGRTRSLHIHTGHQHHREIMEKTTHIFEMHPTLSANDAYAARGGWRSQRAMQVITYHKDFLETSRVIFRPEML